jgi:hypothetical protein
MKLGSNKFRFSSKQVGGRQQSEEWMLYILDNYIYYNYLTNYLKNYLKYNVYDTSEKSSYRYKKS